MLHRLAKELMHEAQMHRLRHPNIVMLVAVVFEKGHYGVLFEYVHYGGLDCFIQDFQVKGGGVMPGHGARALRMDRVGHGAQWWRQGSTRQGV